MKAFVVFYLTVVNANILIGHLNQTTFDTKLIAEDGHGLSETIYFPPSSPYNGIYFAVDTYLETYQSFNLPPYIDARVDPGNLIMDDTFRVYIDSTMHIVIPPDVYLYDISRIERSLTVVESRMGPAYITLEANAGSTWVIQANSDVSVWCTPDPMHRKPANAIGRLTLLKMP